MSFFDIKDSLDKVAYRSFNIMSDAAFLLNFKNRKILSKNKSLKFKHENERCFILGTGPSLLNLSQNNISKLRYEKTFAVNSFYKASFLSTIVPNYYVLMDNKFWSFSTETYIDICNFYVSDKTTFITDIRASKFIPEGQETIFIRPKNFPIDKMRINLDGNMSITMNVVGFSILSALYMGFKEVYLLGCDYNSFCTPNATQYCHDNNYDEIKFEYYNRHKNLAFLLKYFNLTTEFHYLIEKTAKDMNVNIVNLTEGSLLDAYKRGRIDAIL